MDNSAADHELKDTRDCMEDEVDDGEVWEGVNNSDIEGDIQEFTYISSNVHPVHSGIDADIDSDKTSRVVTFILVLLSKWSSRYNISLAAITALIRMISCLFTMLGKFSSFFCPVVHHFNQGLTTVSQCNSNDFRRLVSCPKCHTL